MISAFEAAGAERSWSPAIDVFPLEVTSAPALEERMQALATICARAAEPGPVRAALDELSWSLFEASMGAVPRQVLAAARENVLAVLRPFLIARAAIVLVLFDQMIT